MRMLSAKQANHAIHLAPPVKACSVDDGNAMNRIERIEHATKVFSNASTNELGLTDKCYLYFMKCISNNVTDMDHRKAKMIELFSLAGEGGFISADVLKLLKASVSEEEYTQIAGRGRLADKWVENVTSGMALYTDGTMGGAGKNARRKGKSTSKWAKKQGDKEQKIQLRLQAKAEKKRLKKTREERASKRR